MFVKSINSVLKTSAILMVLFLGLVSCKKKVEEIIPPPELTNELDICTAFADLNSIFDDLDILLDSGATIPYALVQKKDSSFNGFNQFLSIDYINTTEINKHRSGTLKCFINGKRNLGNYNDSVVFENTYINQRLIKGYFKTIQTKKSNDSLIFNFIAKGTSANLSGLSIEFSTGPVVKTKIGIKNNTWKDSTRFDDEWSTKGPWLVKNGQGEMTIVNTASPLIIKRLCSYPYPTKGFPNGVPVQGVVDFVSSISQRIKYGDGICDNQATYIDKKGQEYVFFIE